MSVEVINESAFEAIDEAEYVLLCRFVLGKMEVDPLADVSVVFVVPDEMARLHMQWMGLEGPTDVMSFPVDELRPGAFGQKPNAFTPSVSQNAPQMYGETPILDLCLGDIVICPEVAAKQASGTGHSTHEEMLLLCVHGLLHLMGYDHVEDSEKQVMFELQKKLLFGYIATRESKDVADVQIAGLPE